MTKCFVLTAFTIFTSAAFCQDFSGFRNGNYTGVNGVFYNPANIADSRYRFDVNLLSVHTAVGNNQASFNLKSIARSVDIDSLQQQVFGPNSGASSGLVNIGIHGPSVMVNTGKKSAIAITTRFRTTANIIDIDGRLANQLLEKEEDMNYPYTISSNQNMQLTVNSWTEVGVSYARVLSDKGPHFFKGGVSLKYLAGITNGYINIDNLKASIQEDDVKDQYLYNTTGRIAAGFGGIKVSDFEAANALEMNSTGLGADLGFVYEFRPDHGDYKLDERTWRQDLNKYKFKVGVAILDIGKIKYEKDPARTGNYDIHVTGTERLYLDELSETEIDDYSSYFNSKPQYFTPLHQNETEYKVSLPSTLQFDLDYHIHRGFYTSVAAQIPMNSNKVYNNRNFESYTLTPRYEGKGIGVFIPINYNSLTKMNAGMSLRFGPLFIGSGSVFTAAFGSSKQADIFFGLHIAGLQKNKTKKKK